jgi:short-subunit dehydrogenase
MKESGGDKIINVGSICGYRPTQNVGIDLNSQAAVLAVTKSMALELGQYNIKE